MPMKRPQNARWLPFVLVWLSGSQAAAQTPTPMVRLAKIEVHAAHLDAYRAALKEETEASVRLEPGVRTLYAVAEKDNPTRFTILEIYADSAAYRGHLQTPHFRKYKTETERMVKSLELVAVEPLVPGMKIK